MPTQPVSADPLANTSFKITEDKDVWLFEISHPESATCGPWYNSGYNYNCRLTLQYRVTSVNTKRSIFANGKVLNEQNIKVGFFGGSTFMDEPSPQWKREMLEVEMKQSGIVYLAIDPMSTQVVETIFKTAISLKVKSVAEQAAEQAATLKKESDDLRARQQLQSAKKMTITCVKGKQKKIVIGEIPTCPSGFKNPMSSYLTFQAFSKCQLYKKDAVSGGAQLTDGGRTLILNVTGSRGDDLDKLTDFDFNCAKVILGVSSFVGSQISTTRAIDGLQRTRWGKILASWNFHPDSGLNISFNSK